jgi:PAS domain S-box-containing protein
MSSSVISSAEAKMKQRDDWHLTELLHNATGRGDPFAAAVRATRMPMVITDPARPDNPIVFANEAFQQLTGYSRKEIVGRNCRFLQGPDTDRTSLDKVRAAIDAGRSIDIDLLNYRKDGTSFWNALYMSPVRSDQGEIQFFFASQLDVTERVEAQDRLAQQKALVEQEVEARTADLTAALEAKTLLLHEVDHRVKNNLTMIGSLLRLQARAIKDPAMASKLNNMLERVDALATVHRRLYQSDDITKFDIGAFAKTLVGDVIGASGRSDIIVEDDVQSVEVGADQATPFGLALNEIVTNAVKHGFADGRGGTLRLGVRSNGDSATIDVADDGPGMGSQVVDGLGRTLIRRLSSQFGGSAAWSDAGPGTRVSLILPMRKA